MAQQRQPAIVAEIGRPETAEETADRKAATSRRHRANQTLLNLVVALVASLAVVLFLVVVVVRPAPERADPIDYQLIAVDAQPGAAEPLVAPELPPGWYANDARFGTTAEVATWYVGFVTPQTQFIALNQGIGANPTWLSSVLNSATESGSVTIDGLTWDVYDQRDSVDAGNYAYSMSTVAGGSTIILHGTAAIDEFELLAASIAAEVSAAEVAATGIEAG